MKDLDESGFWGTIGKFISKGGRKAKTKPLEGEVFGPKSGVGTTAKPVGGSAAPEAAAYPTPKFKTNLPKAKTTTTAPKAPARPVHAGKLDKVSTALSGAAVLGATGVALSGKKDSGETTPSTSAPSTSDNSTSVTSSTPSTTTSGADASKPTTFGQAFAAARKAAAEKGAKTTGQFEYQGKKYQTNIRGTGTVKKPQEKYVATGKQTKVDTAAPKPVSPPTTTPVKHTLPDINIGGAKPAAPATTTPSATTTPTTPTTTPTPTRTEYGPPMPTTNQSVKTMARRGKQPTQESVEMTDENDLISAFLKLQNMNSGNIFEAAKKLKKLDPVGKEDDDVDNDGDVDKSDKYLKHRRDVISKNVEEGNIDPVITGSRSVTKDPKKYVDPSTPTKPYSELPKPGNAAGSVIDKAKGALDKKGVREETEELDEGILGNVARGFKGMAVQGERTAGGKFGAATTAERAARNVGAGAKVVADKPGAAALAAGAAGTTMAAGSMIRNRVDAAQRRQAADSAARPASSGRPHDNTTPGQGSTAHTGGATSPSDLGTTAQSTHRPTAPSGRPHVNAAPGQGSTANVGGASSPSQLGTTAQATMSPNKQTATAPLPPRRPANLGGKPGATGKEGSFGAAFKAARQAAGGKGGDFTWHGKQYQTNVAGEKSLPSKSPKLRNMNPKGPSMSEEVEEINFSEAELEHFESFFGKPL